MESDDGVDDGVLAELIYEYEYLDDMSPRHKLAKGVFPFPFPSRPH